MLNLRKLRDDLRGISAVEFALILPFIVALMLGGYELTQAINTDRKVTLVARTVADLTAQTEASNITPSEMTNLILKAGKTVISPYDESAVKIVVSSLRVNSAGTNAVVKWSTSTTNAVADRRTIGANAPIDTILKVRDTSLIWAEVTYPYTPNFGSAFSGIINLKESLFMRPRTQDCIKFDDKGC